MNFHLKNFIQNVSFISISFSAIIICCAFFSCKNSNQPVIQTKANNNKSASASTVFYPVNNYIRQQIKLVDSVPYYVYRIVQKNGKRDSSTISRTVFYSLAKQFILPELEEAAMKKNFEESVYEDESTNSYTLTYSPKNNSTIVQSAIVLLDTASKNVKWIFINTLENKNDSTIIQKMGWKGGKSCYINRSITSAKGKEKIEQLNIVWNEDKE